MSILLNVPSIGLPEKLAFGVLLLLTLAAPFVLWKAQVFRGDSIGGRARLSPREPGWRLFFIFLVGVFTFIFVQVAFNSVLVVERRNAGITTPLTAADFTPGQWAFATNVPWLATSAVLLAGNWLIRRPRGLRSLGLGLSDLPRGILHGVVAMIVVLPLIGWSSIGLEQLYQRLGYEHPDEHDLLRIIFGTENPAYWWLLLGAIVGVAPFSEELLFRGHLQTMVRKALDWASGRVAPRAPQGFPVMPGPGQVVPPPLPLPPATEAGPIVEATIDEPPAPSPMKAWAAVIVASLLFSAVHPLWTAPLIFLLAVCLGYVYERTGNLWSTIVMHAIFNGLSTWFYFYQTR